jgi:hypothetical protein
MQGAGGAIASQLRQRVTLPLTRSTGVRSSCGRVEVTGFARAQPIQQFAASAANRNPTGKSPQDVGQSHWVKIFRFAVGWNQPYNSGYPVPSRGALAIVTNVGRGCGGRDGAKDERAVAYGEIVWVRRPGAGVKLAEAKAGRGRWWQQSRSPGRSRISRKAIAQGRPDVLR